MIELQWGTSIPPRSSLHVRGLLVGCGAYNHDQKSAVIGSLMHTVSVQP